MENIGDSLVALLNNQNTADFLNELGRNSPLSRGEGMENKADDLLNCLLSQKINPKIRGRAFEILNELKHEITIWGLLDFGLVIYFIVKYGNLLF